MIYRRPTSAKAGLLLGVLVSGTGAVVGAEACSDQASNRILPAEASDASDRDDVQQDFCCGSSAGGGVTGSIANPYPTSSSGSSSSGSSSSSGGSSSGSSSCGGSYPCEDASLLYDANTADRLESPDAIPDQRAPDTGAGDADDAKASDDAAPEAGEQ
jgi:hypothetical protein